MRIINSCGEDSLMVNILSFSHHLYVKQCRFITTLILLIYYQLNFMYPHCSHDLCLLLWLLLSIRLKPYSICSWDNFDEFWSVNKKLVDSSEKVAHLPIRLYKVCSFHISMLSKFILFIFLATGNYSWMILYGVRYIIQSIHSYFLSDWISDVSDTIISMEFSFFS